MTAALLLIGVLLAQAFDAASVKRSQPGSVGGSTFQFLSGGGLKVENGTLKGLIETAYNVRDFQISGGPGWLNSERYDLLARSASGEPAVLRAEEMRATRVKLQSLLAERFQLKVHRETRELQEYALTLDRKGSKLIVEAPLTSSTDSRTGIQSTCGHMTGTRASMANLTVYLSRQLNRPVVDRTGLTAQYNFELEWTPDLNPCAESADTAPSIFTALQDQLGLKLDSIKGPVETLVVDRAEKPVED